VIDMIMDGEEEWRIRYSSINYSLPPFNNYENDVKDYVATYLPSQLKIFEGLLQNNNHGKGWFVGQQMSCVDCLMFEMLDIHEILSHGCLEKYPLLNAFRKRFMEIPSIADYIKNRRKTRINGNGKGQ